MKKLFTLIVAICATTLAWADDSGSCGENVTYSFVESTGTLTISGTGYMEDFTSSSKVPWNAYRSSIKKVVINNGVTSIGYDAFYGCKGLTSVTIPNSVTSIGGSAFSDCTGLTSITIPNSVTSIGDYAFGDCTGLTSITIPNSVTSIGLCAFDGTAWYDNQPDGLVYAGNVAYKYKGIMPNDTSVKINEGTVAITPAAFLGCKGLTSVTIPNSVTSIGKEAFYGCTGLTSVTIPNSVTSIGHYAFYETAWYNNQPDGLVYAGNVAYKYKGTMPNNTSVTIKEGTVGIAGSAFYGCTGLTSIEIPNSVTSIGAHAFSGCTGLTSIEIPNSVTSIGAYAFSDCTGLTSINVAEDNLNYASIDGVLYSKDKKTLRVYPQGKTGSFTIPNSVTSIGDGAFDGCEGLTSVTIPNSVTSIGEDAFYGCTGLTSITIPNSVTSIGEWAFDGCKGLTSMTVEATNPPLCVNNYGAGLAMPDYNIPLYVPEASVDAYKAADEWKKFTNIQAIPNVGVKEATAEKSEVKKVIDRNGIIYIEKDGTRYFLNGGKVE